MRTTHPILMHDSSNDAVWSKEALFGGQNYDNLCYGGLQPQYHQYFSVSREIPAKTRLLNNFLI